MAGHRGTVGAAIVRRLEAAGVSDILARTHRELDLTDTRAVDAFFAETRPSRVYLAAAKVGGIQANNSFPAAFIHQNLMIEANIIHTAWRNGVERLFFLGSSCIYPRLAPQPIGEEALLTGTLESTNEPSLIRIMQQVQPDELYNLAAQSHVAVSFEEPEYTADSDGIGTLCLLEAIRILGLERKTLLYQASTSELFGKVQEVPQSETKPFYPRSPYADANASTWPNGTSKTVPTTHRPSSLLPASMISRFENAQRRLGIEVPRLLAMAPGTVTPSDRLRSSPGQEQRRRSPRSDSTRDRRLAVVLFRCPDILPGRVFARRQGTSWVEHGRQCYARDRVWDPWTAVVHHWIPACRSRRLRHATYRISIFDQQGLRRQRGD